MNKSDQINTSGRLGGGPVLPAPALAYYKKHAKLLARAEGVPCSITRLLTRLAHTAADITAIILNSNGSNGDEPTHHPYKPKVTSRTATASSK